MADRDKLRIILASFRSIQMWTFTVNPAGFPNPEMAFRHVQRKRMLAKWVARMRKLGFLESKRYYWVLEFQQNGWPHWHLILETNYVPHDVAWAEWNKLGCGDPETNFGYVSFSKGTGSRDKAKQFKNSRHAAYYVMKYVIKEPEYGWPQWVLDYRGNIMRCRGSNGLFKSVDMEDNRKALAEDIEQAKKTRGRYKRKTTVQCRIGACGESALIFAFNRGSYRYLGRVPHGAEAIEAWFGEPAWEFHLPFPGFCEATDRLIWSYLGMSKKGRGRVVMDGGGVLSIDDNHELSVWSPDDGSPQSDAYYADLTAGFDNPEWMGED